MVLLDGNARFTIFSIAEESWAEFDVRSGVGFSDRTSVCNWVKRDMAGNGMMAGSELIQFSGSLTKMV